MRVLITGGAGKLGSMVVKSLVKSGHHVNIFDLPYVDYSLVSRVPRVQFFKGDIANLEELRAGCEGVDAALHLAAILPPHSEMDEEKTMLVNAEGTACVVKALESTSSAPIIFSSSVSVYGRTQEEKPPVATSHTLKPTDNYSKSKILAEEVIRGCGLRFTILRISGVYAAVPFEFPSPVQFRAGQRVEFVDRDDVVAALVAAVGIGVEGKTYNIAGGESWRMTGERFVSEVFEAFGLQGEVDYPSEYGYFDWYDTEESQKQLGYQHSPFPIFKKRLARAFAGLGGS